MLPAGLGIGGATGLGSIVYALAVTADASITMTCSRMRTWLRSCSPTT